MQKVITRIVAFLLIGTLFIHPEYPNPIPSQDNGGISTLNHGDEEPAPKKCYSISS